MLTVLSQKNVNCVKPKIGLSYEIEKTLHVQMTWLLFVKPLLFLVTIINAW